MSKTRVAPLPVELLTTPIHMHFVVHRPQAGCAVCRTWPRARRGRRSRAIVMACQRCGIEFHDTCYFARVAAPSERVLIEVGTEAELLTDFIFMCQGCRS